MNSKSDGDCRYSDIFGKPGTGVHSYRLFGVAIVDVVLTIILGIFISKVTGLNQNLSILYCFLAGIVLHHLFCVKTTVEILIFGK